MYCLLSMCCGFVFFFLYLISNLIVLWSEKRLEMISFFFFFPKFTKAWFVAQDVIHPGVSSMCTWEKKWNLLSLDEISCRYWLGPSDPMYLSKLVFLKGLTALVGRSEVPKQQEEINCKCQTFFFLPYTKLKEAYFNSVLPWQHLVLPEFILFSNLELTNAMLAMEMFFLSYVNETVFALESAFLQIVST